MPGEAVLALHSPGLTAEQVAELLVRLVTELGVGEEGAFLPADAAPEEPGEGYVVVPIHPPAGAEERAPLVTMGALRCRLAHAEALPVVELLAAHAGAALASIAHQAEVRRVAERLQDVLLPPVPEIPGTLIEVRYRAASKEARVGGDFYDVFPLPDDRVLLTVGDVMGKGIEAAGRTSLITHTTRALALQGLPLDLLLERLDVQVCYQDPHIMATVWCGLYEPKTGELSFASLGHPPALLLRSESDPIHLTMEGLPLGMRDLFDEPPETRDRQLRSRDLLVLYTDGLVETSGDYLSGQEALLEAVVARHGEPLDTLVDEVMDELLSDAGHTDDAVVLALRRR
jgi:phosphoserine phosphatase RsbU/P